jgi:hypothetical protein
MKRGILTRRSPWLYYRAGELDDVLVDEGSAATVVSARRDSKLGIVPVAPAASSVKKLMETIFTVFLARRSWQGRRGSAWRQACRAPVHGVGFD